YHGRAQQGVGVAVVMVERGRSDVRQSAYGASRKPSLAFILKNLQSGGEQSSACVHAYQYNSPIETCIPLLYHCCGVAAGPRTTASRAAEWMSANNSDACRPVEERLVL